MTAEPVDILVSVGPNSIDGGMPNFVEFETAYYPLETPPGMCANLRLSRQIVE
jgi:hypothetical protein